MRRKVAVQYLMKDGPAGGIIGRFIRAIENALDLNAEPLL